MTIPKGGSNNTNKLSPQEPSNSFIFCCVVQIIQINLVLKNIQLYNRFVTLVQIIQINLVLKNNDVDKEIVFLFK